jgi:RIO-like serine/threonine protein kinase
MFDNLKLTDIPKKQCGIIRNSSSTRPVIWRIEENGVKAIIKDFSLNGFWFRNIVGRFLIWREKKAYKRIAGLAGVPALYGSIGGIALIIEEIQGTDISRIEVVKSLDEHFFKGLENLVTRIHDRGIAHCDLKRAPNIMIGNDRNPYIIDWAASISKSELGFFPLSTIYKKFIQDDLNAITKIKLKWQPESVSPEEKRLYDYQTRVEKIIRAIRDWFKTCLKKFA